MTRKCDENIPTNLYEVSRFNDCEYLTTIRAASLQEAEEKAEKRFPGVSVAVVRI